MNLPRSLRIGAYDIAIVPMTPAQVQAAGASGSFSPAELIIRIEPIGNPVAVVDTLLHEIGHAIYHAYLLESADPEERTVATMATAWTQIYRDNPGLLDWISGMLEPAPSIDGNLIDMIMGVTPARTPLTEILEKEAREPWKPAQYGKAK
jgi:hypothetical protein